MSYQGYVNYETWATALWLQNDYGLYQECRSIVRRLRCPIDQADALKALVQEAAPFDALGGTLFADLLTQSLSYVEWSEVVEAFEDESEDEAEEPDEEDEEED